MLTRQREILKWCIGVLASAAIVLGIAWLFESNKAVTESRSRKAAVLQNHRERSPASVPAGQAKGGASLEIELTPVGTQAPGVLSLKATVEAQIDMADARFQWVLPVGVSMSPSEVEGSFGDLVAGDSKTIESSFNVSATANQQIHLQVFTMVDGEKRGEVVQYNTLRQEELNRSVASKRERLEAQIESGARKPTLVH